jgi:hypothetical protein
MKFSVNCTLFPHDLFDIVDLIILISNDFVILPEGTVMQTGMNGLWISQISKGLGPFVMPIKKIIRATDKIAKLIIHITK